MCRRCGINPLNSNTRRVLQTLQIAIVSSSRIVHHTYRAERHDVRTTPLGYARSYNTSDANMVAHIYTHTREREKRVSERERERERETDRQTDRQTKTEREYIIHMEFT